MVVNFSSWFSHRGGERNLAICDSDCHSIGFATQGSESLEFLQQKQGEIMFWDEDPWPEIAEKVAREIRQKRQQDLHPVAVFQRKVQDFQEKHGRIGSLEEPKRRSKTKRQGSYLQERKIFLINYIKLVKENFGENLGRYCQPYSWLERAQFELDNYLTDEEIQKAYENEVLYRMALEGEALYPEEIKRIRVYAFYESQSIKFKKRR